jgi:type I site-specific restriction-modification system R (restriction) subunit
MCRKIGVNLHKFYERTADMPQQNFENDNIKTRIVDGRLEIFDCLRGKYVAMTPEENVRQMFVRHLIDGKRYPAGLMGNEIAINQNGRERRCDTVVFDRRGCPLMIVEYKAPSVKITQEVFNQVYRYNTVLRVKYLTVCNGRQLFCCRVDYDANKAVFLKDVPCYDDL